LTPLAAQRGHSHPVQAPLFLSCSLSALGKIEVIILYISAMQF